jgi:tetratricopeptide (TPR) repeat protein
MKKMIIAGLVLVTFGCASTPQNSAMDLAYSSFANGDYKSTLMYVTKAEQERSLTAELQAEFAFLKAQAYEELGDRKKAEGLYDYLKERHPNSQYGFLAKRMLESSEWVPIVRWIV